MQRILPYGNFDKEDIIIGTVLFTSNPIQSFSGLLVMHFTAMIGDFTDPASSGPDYLTNLKLLPHQSERLERKIAEQHREHAYVHTRTHIHTHIQICTHAHIYTHSHIHTQLSSPPASNHTYLPFTDSE